MLKSLFSLFIEHLELKQNLNGRYTLDFCFSGTLVNREMGNTLEKANINVSKAGENLVKFILPKTLRIYEQDLTTKTDSLEPKLSKLRTQSHVRNKMCDQECKFF